MSKTKYQNVYRDKNGEYYISVYIGRNKVTGKKKIKKAKRDEKGNHFKTAKQASNEVQRIKRKYKDASKLSSDGLTYGEFMEKIFLPMYKGNVQTGTWDSRQTIFKIVQNWFGDKKLSQISPLECLQFRTWLLDTDEGNYSQGYASQIYTLFRKTLDEAVDLEFVSKNVARQKNALRAIPKGKREISYWNLETFEKVISCIYTDDFYENMCFVALWLYFMTGMRVGEGLALFWDSVDFDSKCMYVNHTLERYKGGKYYRKPHTKTINGERTINIDDDTVALLKRWKKRQTDYGLKYFVLSVTDQPIYKDTIGRIIRRYAKLADVEPIKPKELRHSHASLLINKYNFDVLTVSKRLGHSSPEITLKYYARFWSGRSLEVANRLSGVVKYSSPHETMINFNGNQSIKKKIDVYQKST
ncbi:tyrosine-type recombinase/integrase [Ligilactobacillus pobuzihii]|uniref:Integrase n=1 Tax=Ligilactobacillus pobuzihii TaxID=449659 RepID=A0A0R2L4Z7_9LACO|nr:site-specific integrase [Ligilactobacillus pobuzihii]KRK09791.1 integrase [Ligilactobacillus pobuzihii E100301 = KCTC 13174]KRN96782.1 integrase [Ligilactobacillus pobuzihii]GEN48643.1 site-specific integrase [Ligilactobacillus pobuzihii]